MPLYKQQYLNATCLQGDRLPGIGQIEKQYEIEGKQNQLIDLNTVLKRFCLPLDQLKLNKNSF